MVSSLLVTLAIIIALVVNPIVGPSVICKKKIIKGERPCSIADTILSTNEEKGALNFETDIILTDEQKEKMNQKTSGTSKGAASLPTSQGAYKTTMRLWDNGIIPYTIANGVDPTVFKQAIEHWENHTCLRFVPRTVEPNYVELINTEGCSSYVGCTRQGKQTISLDPRCTIGPAIHEIGHTAGFWHEQSRPDRDKYIQILWNNIIPGYGYHFIKHSTNIIDSLNISYDYYSVMHYSLYSFSSNQQPTMWVEEAVDYNKIGNARQLSVLDIEQANRLYNCSNETSNYNSTMMESKSQQVMYFALYNKAVNKCLSAQEMKHSYHLTDPLSSTQYEVVLTNCNKENSFQQWSVDYSHHIVHRATKLCLSSTINRKFVLTMCSMTTTNDNWRMKWSCDSHLIIQPQSGLCLSTQHYIDSSQLLIKELNDVFQPHASIDHQSKLHLVQCNASNVHQFFTTIGPNANSTICDLFPTYQIPNCYIEHTKNTQGWMRCEKYGYFVSGFQYMTFTSPFIAGLICCQATSNVASGHHHPLSPASTCFHRSWWTSVGLSMFQCLPGEYLHGLRFIRRYAIQQVECCKISSRDVYNYSHCDKVLNSFSCVGEGVFVTQYSNSCIGSWGTRLCSKELECCY